MAFTLGAIAALLAGACVAPVVISVLLMATDLHAKGVALGLALPFLLGVGMALPWPFMGASLSFLPKPGKWMVWVKYTFGVAIILFAVYYGNMCVRPLPERADAIRPGRRAGWGQGGGRRRPDAGRNVAGSAYNGQARVRGFAASWCKNCEAMDFTVFNQSNVQRRLKDFVLVRYQAERPNESPAKDVLDHFKVLGLPTYLVLSSK